MALIGLFAVCTAVPIARAQSVAHPLVDETLWVRTANPNASVVVFESAGKAATLYQLPFQVGTVSKLYADGPRAFLVGTTGAFDFGASYGTPPTQPGNLGAIMIGYGFSTSPEGDYLAWVQYYPRLALAPDRGTVRLMKTTEAFVLTAPPDELRTDAGIVLFAAPSAEILLYPNIEWSGDGRLAFLSQDSAGKVNVIVCRASTNQCGNVGSVEGENRVTKLSFAPRGISLDLASPASKKSNRFLSTP